MTARYLRLAVAFLAILARATPVVRAQAGTATAIPPGDNLVVDGLPTIPGALAADVRRYTESRGAGLVDWHPARREILIATRFGNTTQLHQVKMPGGARTQLTFFDEPVGGGSYDPGVGASSCSAATRAATSSRNCTATTSPTGRSRC